MKKHIIFLLSIMLIVVGLGIYFLHSCKDDWCAIFNWQKAKLVNNFDKCAKLVKELPAIYPPICTINGKTYVQSVPTINTPPVLRDNSNITLTSPQPNTQVSSPLTITGQAVGNWYFEASFPVKLYDANNTLLATAPAQAQGDWMTPNFVPFSVTLTFSPPTTTTGTLILEKDNPSGEPQNADSISIPVNF